MLIAAGGFVFVALLTIAFVGVTDARIKLRCFEIAIDNMFPTAKRPRTTGDSTSTGTTLPKGVDEIEHNSSEVAFTSLLLAAMNPHSQTKPVCPEVISEEIQSSGERARIE